MKDFNNKDFHELHGVSDEDAVGDKLAVEFERLMDSIERYEQAPADEVDEDEYAAVLKRYEELRRLGYGPQPHHLDVK